MPPPPTVDRLSAQLSLRNKKGFTLAETLITLAIIGIVAALTVPTLVSKYKKAELQTRFKQASAIIYKFQENTFKDSDNPANVIVKDQPNQCLKMQEYFNVKNAKSCYIYFNDWKNKYKTLNNKKIDYFLMDDGTFELDNGMRVFVNGPDGRPIGFTIDTNGDDNGPNKFGYDVFFWGSNTRPPIDENCCYDTLKPGGQPGFNFTPKASFCDYNSNNNLNGYGCAYWATVDPDYFNNLKF